MDLVFDTNGNEKQKQCVKDWIDDSISEIVYGGSKGSAKSYTGCQLIFGDALTYPETYYFIARKQLNDLRKFTIPSIYEVFSHWGIDESYYRYNGQDSYFTLYNGSRIYLLDAKWLPSDPLFYRFGSMQMTRGWIEEAGEFEESAKNNLFASIGRWNNDKYGLVGKLLQTCNPAKNYLYRLYKGWKDGTLPDHISFIQALPDDNKKLPKGYLENLHRILSPTEKERLLFGNWEYDDDPSALIDYNAIINIFTNDFVSGNKKYISADIARYGSDKLVIMLWDGLRVEKVISLDKSSTVEAENIILKLSKEKSVPRSNIVIDDDGVGGGVTDHLPGCVSFVNNSKALNDENYQNLKSQCYFKLAELINDNSIYINPESLPDTRSKDNIIQELEYVKQANIDKDGKKQVLAKEKIKQSIGRSPDYADSLMMRMYFEIKPSADLSKVQLKRNTKTQEIRRILK